MQRINDETLDSTIESPKPHSRKRKNQHETESSCSSRKRKNKHVAESSCPTKRKKIDGTTNTSTAQKQKYVERAIKAAATRAKNKRRREKEEAEALALIASQSQDDTDVESEEYLVESPRHSDSNAANGSECTLDPTDNIAKLTINEPE